MKMKHKGNRTLPNTLPITRISSWHVTLESELQYIEWKRLAGEDTESDIRRLLELEQRVVADRLESARLYAAQITANMTMISKRPRQRLLPAMRLQIEAFCRQGRSVVDILKELEDKVSESTVRRIQTKILNL
jgi:hypothetical protein